MMAMLHTPVQSSNLKVVGYDKDTQTLEVTFHGEPPRTYRYTQVPPNIVAALVTAPSIGKYFHAHIRSAYTFQRIR